MTNPNMQPQGTQEPEQEATKPAVLLRVTRENMEVELQFQRTGVNTLNPQPEDVFAELEARGIVYGINEDHIRRFCQKPEYNETLVIGHGKKPQRGRDGELQYMIRTDRELRPKIHEDGTADFKDLGFLQTVRKDQPLCKIIPPEKGEDGCDVYGNVLEGLYGKEAPNPSGKNTYYSEDRVYLLATCDGNVELRKGVISVMDVLYIMGNVDNATGNLKHVGDIIISGDVASGFKVQAEGSIVVKGSVEGAILDADKNISIGESINGRSKGWLTAKGDIKCKHIQSCTVRVEGSIYADTILYCDVECGGDIELSGKKAALIGGKTAVTGRLFARTLGTSTHIVTEINMCAGGVRKEKDAEEIMRYGRELDGEIAKLVQILTRYDELKKKAGLTQEHIATIQKVKESYVQLSAKRKDAHAQLERIKKEQLEASEGKSYIECRNRIHTGVRMAFGPLVMQVNESFVYSRIGIAGGEIAITPL